MAGAEKLIEKILSDARAAADENLAGTRREAETIMLKARGEERALRDALLLKAEREASALEKRLISVAETEGRKAALAVKQRLIDELFERAITLLCEKPDAEYEALLAGMLSISANGDEEVALSERDLHRLSGGFINSANRALEAKGTAGRLTLSENPAPLRGGFILRSGQIEINDSFESIAKVKKDSLEPLAVKMLFG